MLCLFSFLAFDTGAEVFACLTAEPDFNVDCSAVMPDFFAVVFALFLVASGVTFCFLCYGG